MITKGLLELLFEAASIQRWNDHNRPEHFTELDKQAHKIVYAYVLGRFEETDRGTWTGALSSSVFFSNTYTASCSPISSSLFLTSFWPKKGSSLMNGYSRNWPISWARLKAVFSSE